MYFRATCFILLFLFGITPAAQAANIANVSAPAKLIKLRDSFEKKQRETYRNNLRNYKKQLDELERKYQQKNSSVELFSVRAEKRKIIKDIENITQVPSYKKMTKPTARHQAAVKTKAKTEPKATTMAKPSSKPEIKKVTKPTAKHQAAVKTTTKPKPKSAAMAKPGSKSKIKGVAIAKPETAISKAKPIVANKVTKKTALKAAAAQPAAKKAVTKKTAVQKNKSKKVAKKKTQKTALKPLPLVAGATKAATAPIAAPAPIPAKTLIKSASTTKAVAPKPLPKAKPVPITKREPVVHISDINGISGSPAFSVNNIYKFKLVSIGVKSTLKYYAAGRRTINSFGTVWLIDKTGKKTMLHKWNPKDFTMPAMEAKKYKELTPTVIDITPHVTKPGVYKVEFDYLDGIDALGILRVEIIS